MPDIKENLSNYPERPQDSDDVEQSPKKRGRKKHQEKRAEAQEIFSVGQIHDALRKLISSEQLQKAGITWEDLTTACWNYLHSAEPPKSDSQQFFDLKDFANLLDIDYKVIYRIAREQPEQLATSRVGWQYRVPVVGAALYVLIGHLHLEAEEYKTREFYSQKLNENPLQLLTAPKVKEKFRKIWQEILTTKGVDNKAELQWPIVAGITEMEEPPKQ